MMRLFKILPGTGRGTSRRQMEGLRRPLPRIASPSVARPARHLPVPGRIK
jgi:hypothetical protein